MKETFTLEHARRRIESHLQASALEERAPKGDPSCRESEQVAPPKLDTSAEQVDSILNKQLVIQQQLSERLDRLAIEVFRGAAAIDRRLTQLQKLLLDTTDQLRTPRTAVEYVEIDDMIIGLPSAEWRLCAYFRHRGVPEPGTFALFNSLLKEGMTVVDIGANVGLYTISAARRVGVHGKVIAFEPSSSTFQLLRENIQVNGLLETGIIDVRRCAIGEVSGRSSFYLSRESCGHDSLFESSSVENMIEVETHSLDALLTDPVDVIKIDAEGAESIILKGMVNTINNNPDLKVIIEFAPSLLERAGVNPASMLDQISSAGFVRRVISEPSGELIDVCSDELLQYSSVNLLLMQERIG